MPTDQLKEILLRCTSIVQFSFNYETYRQRDGISMGSPLNLILTKCFMSQLENNQLSLVIDRFNLYKRYVDKKFSICNETVVLVDTRHSFNTYHSFMDFTLENKVVHSIDFLDVPLIMRSDWFLRRFTHRKKT